MASAAGALAAEKVNALEAKGDHAGARKALEDFIVAQKNEGEKLIPPLNSYLQLTKRTGQTQEAPRFLIRLARRVPARDRGLIEQFLLKAYENAGNKREAAQLRKKLGK